VKSCLSEIKTIVHFLDPLLTEAKDLGQQLGTLKESWLIETLRRNKIVTHFYRKLESDSVLKERVSSLLPNLRVFCDDVNLRSERDLAAFREIKHKFSENNIEFILIKSDGWFPSESDNLDVLIKSDKLGQVSKLLQSSGYSEILRVRERNKYLFRNTRAPHILPLHIHTKVEWESEFVDSSLLWRRAKLSGDDGGFLIPSPEDCVLITCAHLFFENHEVKLADLFKITSKLRDENIDWSYMFEHTSRLYWRDAFCLTILLVDLVARDLSGKSMLPDSILTKVEEMTGAHFQLLQRTLKPFRSGCIPLTIPYAISAFFFLERVLRESDSPLHMRLGHIDRVAANVLRERINEPKT
jgi:hypothetical protein